MERHRFANTDLCVSIIGLGCYGMSGADGPADDGESIATIHRALDLGVNFLDTSASYGQGHNHRLIGEAIRGRRHDVVIHSKSGSPRDGSPDAVRGGDPRYLRQTCEQSLKNSASRRSTSFACRASIRMCQSKKASVEWPNSSGRARHVSSRSRSARPSCATRGSAVHPLASLQMEYSLFSRDAEEQGQIDACKDLGVAMMAYVVLGRGMLSAEAPKVEEMAADDIRAHLPRFHGVNVEKNLRLRAALDVIARRKNATLTQLSIAWPMAEGSRAGAFIVPIPGAKSRKHLEQNVRAAEIVLTADDLAEIDRIVPPGSASGTRYPIGQMHRVNL